MAQANIDVARATVQQQYTENLQRLTKMVNAEFGTDKISWLTWAPHKRIRVKLTNLLRKNEDNVCLFCIERNDKKPLKTENPRPLLVAGLKSKMKSLGI